MRVKRRTEITRKTERIIAFKMGKLTAYGQCEMCGRRVRMLTVDDAAKGFQISSLAIYRLVEARKLHFIETADSLLLVCLESLQQNGINQLNGEK